jgi:hypothetical protein
MSDIEDGELQSDWDEEGSEYFGSDAELDMVGIDESDFDEEDIDADEYWSTDEEEEAAQAVQGAQLLRSACAKCVLRHLCRRLHC